MAKLDSRKIFETLKKILKSKKISYARLSEKISFSESTLKNIFHHNNASIERLMEICHVIDIKFTDLVILAAQEDSSDFSFSVEQEQFFSNSPHYYYFFREIFFEKRSLQQMEEEFSLDGSSVAKYIIALEKIGLLEVHVNNRLKFLVYGKLQWQKDGPWMKKFYPVYSQLITKMQLENLGDDSYLTSFPGFFKISPSSYDHFIQDILEIERKYRDIAFRDSLLTDHEDFIPVTWSFNVVPADVFTLNTHIPNI